MGLQFVDICGITERTADSLGWEKTGENDGQKKKPKGFEKTVGFQSM